MGSDGPFGLAPKLVPNMEFKFFSSLDFTPLRSGGRRSATARTVTRSKRRFRAKTKIKSVLALTAPTLAPCRPSLRWRFSPCPPVTVFVSLPLK